MRAWAVLFLPWAILVLSPSHAYEPESEDSADRPALAFTVYTARDGLSDEIWNAIGFDAEGFVWAGSASGLARFDGYQWVPWREPQARSLVRDLRRDANGRLWAIFEREGLYSYADGRWLAHGFNDVLLQRISDTSSAAGLQPLYIGSERGFLRLEGDSWQLEPGPPGNHGIDIETTGSLFGSRRQWVGLPGLWYRELPEDGAPGPWQRFEHPALDRVGVTDLLRSVDHGQEELWVLTYGAGLIRIREDGLRVWRSAAGELPTEAIYHARATRAPDGRPVLWMASRAGLLRLHGERIDVYDRRHGLPSDAVRALELQRDVDGVDILWLVTEGGIARAPLGRSPWQTVSLLGARFNGIYGVLVEADDRGEERVWVASAKDGLALREAGRWRHFTLANGGLPREGVRQIWRLVGSDGKPWRVLSLDGGGLLQVQDGLRLRTFPSPWDGIPDGTAMHAIARLHQGAWEQWFATRSSGIQRLREGRWTRFDVDAKNGPETGVVLHLAEQVDARGRSWLWASTSLGLALFDGERWTRMPIGLDLPVDTYRSVSILRKGHRDVLWAGTSRNGIVRIDVSDPAEPRPWTGPSPPPPPDPTVYSVLHDSQGRVYVCTNNGVQQLSPLADGSYREQVFRRRDGLVHDECNTNAQMVDHQDRYWVGTLAGLSLYDPSVQIPAGRARPKPLHVTAIRVDGREQRPPSDGPLQVPAAAGELSVEFALLAGQREQESSYRSRLSPYDEDFTAWGGQRRRAYTRLPPGDYLLEVEARDYAGAVASPLRLAIRVQSLWWQRALVQAMLAIAGLLLIVGVVLAYNRHLRQRQRQLKREVALRTAELDQANQRLTELSYRDPLTGVANRRRLNDALEAAVARACQQGLPLGLIVVDVDHFKEYNDRHGHLAGDAALRAVAQALESATRPQDLVARYGGEEFACLMIDAHPGVVAAVAERMRTLVEALPPRVLGNDEQTLTISAGALSRVPAPGTTVEQLLGEADRALYRAKHEGRNRICTVESALV